MKTLIAAALLLSTTSAYAHNSCNAEVEGGLKIQQDSIQFFDQKEALLYEIKNDKSLWIDGSAVQLNPAQQAVVTEYSARIHNVVPEVKMVVIEGLNLASDGFNMAFNELLGEGNTAADDLNEKLATIRAEVDAKFASDQVIYVNHNGIEGDNFLGKEFEQELQAAVEDTVQKAIGSILVAVGKEMIFSGGDSQAFEKRMESFGAKVEQEMESRAELIEAKADQLCQSFAQIDNLEEALKEQVQDVSRFDLFSVTVKQDSHHDDQA
ncbi:DUF2884 family protein [Pseudidiomarina terrestris]|uniref:DUF2884 family protein n=1 Tax=Pseudidiomarina terrestris TaxID=2820060 RepID=UPI0026527EC3|nr:DUF2884 family protein [Pseudidiomarina sp. 1ASP75-5]MDN7135785.1 YggN family protein [Pseudidiomarina sp. 1ASP75-5]